MIKASDFVYAYQRHGAWMIALAPLWIPALLVVWPGRALCSEVKEIVEDILA